MYPNKGSAAVSTALELPRGRIRPWLNGGKPDAVRALDTLADHGWDDLAWKRPPVVALNVLVAWIFAGGSINADHWVPLFAVGNDRERTILADAIDLVGVDGTYEREDESGRATEYRVTTDGSVLGRLLAVLGAPVGEKHADRDLQLPPDLAQAPRDIRLDFARTYVCCRATPRPHRPSTPRQIIEERPPAFRDALRALFRSLGESDWIRGTGRQILLRTQAVELLDMPPTMGTTSRTCDAHHTKIPAT